MQDRQPNPKAKSRERQIEDLRALVQMRRSTIEEETPSGTNPWECLTGRIGPRRLLDCLAGKTGSGCGLIALRLCVDACQKRGELVVIDRRSDFYPPGAIAWGCNARKLIVVSASSDRDALAATEIALRSPAVGAVWADLGTIDGRQFRRLLLATESGEAFGALVRSARHEADPSWGDVQIRFDPVARATDPEAPLLVRVTQTRNRHGPASGEVLLSVDWRTGRVEPQSEASHGRTRGTNDRGLVA